MFETARFASRTALRMWTISFPTMLDAWRSRIDMDTCDQRLAVWSRGILEDARIELQVVGQENLPQAPRAFMVMSNHQSLYDIPVAFQSIPGRMRMVTKIELYRIPVFSQALRASGFIAIDRSDRDKAIKSLEEARRRMNEGVIVWIAPEGTRSRDGSLGPFKKGGFVLALETGVPIVPMTVSGTRDILPARTWDIQFGAKVKVTIHPAIDPREVSDRDTLMARVRESILSAL